MKKNLLPYSEPRNLRIAFVSSFINFAVVNNKFIGQIRNEEEWYAVPCVPGTLQPSCTPNESGMYDILISFRIAFSEPKNLQFIERFKHSPLIARYTSAGDKDKIAGSVENFLTLDISSPSGFDGYECTLRGTQKTLELFV